jgi:GT2 family glycosyltransferase
MIYILLPVHNRKLITEKLIKCLSIQTSKQFRILLIDDGSTDGTDQMVLSYFPDSVILRGYGSLWWAGSLSLGDKWLRKQLLKLEDGVLIINDDTEVGPDFIENGISLLSCNSRTAFLSFCYDSLIKTKLVDKGTKVNWHNLSFTPASLPSDINCLSTRGLFMSLEDFLAVGGFYPKLLPHYLSDYEFTIRAKRKGIVLKSDDSIKVWVDSSTTGFHVIKENTFYMFLSKFFSKKNPSHPFYFSIFILLASPFKFKLINLARVYWIALKQIISNLKLKS